MQSPIDLETNEATPVFYTPFVWENYFTQAQARVKNNGHSGNHLQYFNVLRVF